MNRMYCALAIPAVVLLTGAGVLIDDDVVDFKWNVHDMARPQPVVVAPGSSTTAPSDAVVLLDGSNLDAWRSGDGPCKWTLDGGDMVVKPGTGDVQTAEEFGDCQLHIEWMIPKGRPVNGQGGGNSGVFLMGRYELQVLQSHDNQTYADGMAGSIYGQYPPLVNPTRPQGEWNVYDIVFRAPRFREDGSVHVPARITVHFNGVLVQDNSMILGGAAHARRAVYSAHPDTGPIKLQDHGDPIRFRNTWIRRLEPRKGPE